LGPNSGIVLEFPAAAIAKELKVSLLLQNRSHDSTLKGQLMLHYVYAKCFQESNWTKKQNGCEGGKALCSVLQTDIKSLFIHRIPIIFHSFT